MSAEELESNDSMVVPWRMARSHNAVAKKSLGPSLCDARLGSDNASNASECFLQIS
jgi:hypothetical protein